MVFTGAVAFMVALYKKIAAFVPELLYTTRGQPVAQVAYQVILEPGLGQFR